MKYLLTALAALFIGIILEIHRYVAKPQGEKTTNQTIAKLWIYVRPIGSFLYFWSAFLACNQLLDAFVPWVVGRKQFFLEFVWTLAATISMLLINQRVYQTKESIRTETGRILAQWFFGVLVMCVTVASSKYYLNTSVVVFGILTFTLIVGTATLYVKKKKTYRRVQVTDIGALFFLAIMIFIFGELMYAGNVVIRFDFLLVNSIIIFLVLLLLFVVSKSWNIAVAVGPVLGFVWTMIFLLVYEFRGTVFQPADITAIATAKEVMGGYSFHANRSIIVYLFFALACVVIAVGCKKTVLKFENIRKRIASSCAAVLLVVVLFFSSWTSLVDFELTSTWDLAGLYNSIGYTLGFLEIEKASKAKKPGDYSIDEIEALAEEYRSKNTTDVSEVKPNIIVIMNETLSDLGDLGEYKTNKDYFPFIHSCDKKKNTITGKTLVSVLGGGTCNSEYEFLTGNSTEMLPLVYPFQTEINSDTYSLVTTLKEQGYYTIGTHPNHATNWNREKAYRFLGFDEALFFDDYVNPISLRTGFATYAMLGTFVSDQTVYDNVIPMMDRAPADTPCFLFAVTMQNHSGYDGVSMLRPTDTEFTIRGTENSDGVIDQFLSLMYESDQQFKRFLKKVDELDKPTIVVLFGDHFPNITSKYSQLVGAESAGLINYQKRYATPYVIHANYDIDLESVSEYMGLNYLSSNLLKIAGLEMTPYNQYLLNMEKEIPAMNANGYLNQKGIWHEYDEDDDSTEGLKIKEYNRVQYNNRFGKVVENMYLIDTKEEKE